MNSNAFPELAPNHMPEHAPGRLSPLVQQKMVARVWDWCLIRYQNSALADALISAQDLAGLDVMAAFLLAYMDQASDGTGPSITQSQAAYLWPLVAERRAYMATLRARRRQAKGSRAYDQLKEAELEQEHRSLARYMRLLSLLLTTRLSPTEPRSGQSSGVPSGLLNAYQHQLRAEIDRMPAKQDTLSALEALDHAIALLAAKE